MPIAHAHIICPSFDVLYLEFEMSTNQSSSHCWRCPLCSFFAAPGPKGVLRHIGSIHAHEHSFHITCGVQGCPRSYSNYHSYKKHMYKKHRDVLELDSDDNGDRPLQPMETCSLELYESDTDAAPQSVYSHDDEKRSSALFLM